jgi:hypothetical protein
VPGGTWRKQSLLGIRIPSLWSREGTSWETSAMDESHCLSYDPSLHYIAEDGKINVLMFKITVYHGKLQGIEIQGGSIMYRMLATNGLFLSSLKCKPFRKVMKEEMV